MTQHPSWEVYDSHEATQAGESASGLIDPPHQSSALPAPAPRHVPVPPPPPPRRRRPGGFTALAALVAGLALGGTGVGIAGTMAWSQQQGPEQVIAAPVEKAEAEGPAHRVEYVVTADREVSVTYTVGDDQSMATDESAGPWRHQTQAHGGTPLELTVTIPDPGPRPGTITCSIVVDGQTVSTSTVHVQDSMTAAHCSAVAL